MKATIANLKKALKACASAHNIEFHYWRDDNNVTLHSDVLPVYADVKMIVESFYGEGAMDCVETAWGFTIVWLDCEVMDTKRAVNEDLMYLALPYGTKLN